MSEEHQDFFDFSEFHPEPALGGNNFLVSAVMLLKKQKQDLQKEVQSLRARLDAFENGQHSDAARSLQI